MRLLTTKKEGNMKWKVIDFIGSTVAEFKSYKAAQNYVMKRTIGEYKIERIIN
jgi:hypothetical protein